MARCFFMAMGMRKRAKAVLRANYDTVREEDDYLRVYDVDDTAFIVDCLMKHGHVVSEIKKNKIGLEEYYIELMSATEEKSAVFAKKVTL